MKDMTVFLRTILVTASIIGFSMSAHALTLKSGQVMGGDGNVYDGASPEQKENIIKNADRVDFFGNKKSSGVIGSNLFLVVEGETVFIPINDLAGKSRDTVTEIVRTHILEVMTASLTKFHSEGATAADSADIAADIAQGSAELANSAYLEETVNKAAEFAAVDAALASDYINAVVGLATVDATNEAARVAAEASFEAAFEAANEAATEAYDAINGEGAYCEQDPNCEIWTPESE